MNLILAFAAVAVASAQPPAAPVQVPDSAATLVPISLEELRHFADALAAIAASARRRRSRRPFPRRPSR